MRRLAGMTPEEQLQVETLAVIEGLEFANGIIEAELAVVPASQETPSRYESYVDLMPGTWTRIKIEVHGDRARLYVHGQEQATMIVNDVKTGGPGQRCGGTLARSRHRRAFPRPASRVASPLARKRKAPLDPRDERRLLFSLFGFAPPCEP